MRLIAVAVAVAGLAITGTAHAADLPPAPPPPPRAPVAYVPVPPPPFSWTGFYIGGNLGAGWSQGNVNNNTTGISALNQSTSATFLGGGQVGVNYQFMGGFVVGAEADFDWAFNGNNTVTGTAVPSGDQIQISSNNRWITMLAARFGYAFDRVLVYGKGGGGWVGNNGFTVADMTTGASATIPSNTNTGWLAGAGIEWAFARSWTARLEYDYIGLSNTSLTVPSNVPAIAGDVITTSGRDVQMFTAGVNYLFNW